MQASTFVKRPSRIYQALLPSSSSATPGQIISVPGRWFFSISSLTAIAAKMITACPELCPSPCPGAPSTIGDLYATPGFCEAFGIQSISLPSAITGLPLPHRAIQEVGIPETPFSTVNPFFSRTLTRYLEVSNSWNPSSPKLKIMSTISCTDFSLLFTAASACFFNPSIKAESWLPATWPRVENIPINKIETSSLAWPRFGAKNLLMCGVWSKLSNNSDIRRAVGLLLRTEAFHQACVGGTDGL